MARKSGSVVPGQEQLPVQPVDRPILCNPYEEPHDHWIYDKETGAASRAGIRRDASYWYKTERTGSAQLSLLAEEERDDLPLVNALREDVRNWRKAGYPGATNVTRDLLRHWAGRTAHGGYSSARLKPSRPSSIYRRSGFRGRLAFAGIRS